MTAQSIPAAARTLPTEALDDDDPGYDEEIPTGLRRTNRWRGVAGLTLLAIGLGLLLEQPAALLAGVFGVAFAAYGQIGAAPAPDLRVERAIDDEEPAVGDEVPVTVTVTNEGEETLTDLRLVDGIPDGLAVADGAPRGATALRPGSTVELTYEVTATRGAHAFDPLVAITRDVTGATERVVEVDAADRIASTAAGLGPNGFSFEESVTRSSGSNPCSRATSSTPRPALYGVCAERSRGSMPRKYRRRVLNVLKVPG